MQLQTSAKREGKGKMECGQNWTIGGDNFCHFYADVLYVQSITGR